MASRQLEIVLAGKDKGALALLDKAGDQAERTGKKVDGFGNAWASTGTKVAGGAAIATAALWKAGQTSADLEASIETTADVFGDASRQIDAFGATAADSVGLSNRAFHEQAALIGSFAKNMGFTKDEAADLSISMVQLGADMGAAFNKTPEEAIAAIGSAFRGETDPIEAFGVSIKEADISAKIAALGLDTSTSAAEKHSKALAIQAIITEQTADITGKFGREANTLAGQQARAKAASEDATAQLGKGFVPVMEKATGAVTWASKGFGELDNAMGGNASTLASWGVLALGAAGGTSALIGQVVKARESFATAGEGLKGLNAQSAVSAAKFTAIGAAIAGVIAYTDHLKTSSEQTQTGLFKGLDFADLEAANQKLNETGQQINAMGAKWDAYTGSEALFHAEDYKLWADASAQQEEHRKHLDASIAATHQLADALGITAKDAETLALELHIDPASVPFDQLLDVMTRYRSGTITTAEAQNTLKGSTEGATDAVKDQADVMRAQLDPLFAMTKALDDNAESQRRSEQAARDVDRAYADYQQTLLIWGPTMQQTRDAFDRLTEAQDAQVKADQDAVRSAMDVTSAQEGLSRAVAGGTVSVGGGIAVLQAWVRQGLITQAQADYTAESFNYAGARAEELGAKDVSVPVSAPGVEETIWKLAVLAGQIQSIPQRLNIAEMKDRNIPGHATGGGLSEGWNLVGEHGPEPIYKSGSIATVSPTGSGRGAGGATINVTINVQGSLTSERDLVETVRNGLMDILRVNPTLFGERRGL